MRIAIMGSGGLGGYFGAKLAKGGADVHFIARGAHLAAMRAHGLVIEDAQDSWRLERVNATDDPSTVGPVDLVIFGVKLWDTQAAARQVLPIMRPGGALISFQNGVQKDSMLRPIIGEAAVMGGVGYVATHIARPGVIAKTGPMQRLVFGEFDGRRSSRAEAFLAACQAGAINAQISPDIRRDLWEKFVFIVGISGTTAAMRGPIGRIREQALTRQFLLDVMREVVAVGRAHGVAIAEDFAEQRLAFADTMPADMVASMYHDLQAARPLELRWLAGGVVDLGAEVGVPTPMNRAVRDILILHADGAGRQ
ncbi:MAG: 2-dehydropantoate 2-reductase [Proteobacteria bacterium]|nr:2-dehydropantoate 2-reductase [Pseudomonadota bacterium]